MTTLLATLVGFLVLFMLVPHVWCWWSRRTARNELAGVLDCCGKCSKLDIRGRT